MIDVDQPPRHLLFCGDTKPCQQWRPDDSRYCGATPTRLYVDGHRCKTCAPAPLPEVLEPTGPALRPRRPEPDRGDIELARRGELRRQPTGLPPCPEHDQQEQCPPEQHRVRMCVCCGRITARLDGDAVAWCGGVLADDRAKPVRHLAVVR